MGAAVIRYLSQYGAQLRCISDPRIGGTFVLDSNPSSELIKSISEQDFSKTKILLAGMQPLDLEDVLYQKVDILLPCALQDVLTAENAAKVKAMYIVEGANNPCTAEARRYFHNSGIKLVPDFIANPGGVIAAFVEMTTDFDPTNLRKKPEKAKSDTIEKIRQNVANTLNLAREHNIEPASAGKYLAYKNIFKS